VGRSYIRGPRTDVGHFARTLDDLRFPGFADDFAAQARSAERLRRPRDAAATCGPATTPTSCGPAPSRPRGRLQRGLPRPLGGPAQGLLGRPNSCYAPAKAIPIASIGYR